MKLKKYIKKIIYYYGNKLLKFRVINYLFNILLKITPNIYYRLMRIIEDGSASKSSQKEFEYNNLTPAERNIFKQLIKK